MKGPPPVGCRLNDLDDARKIARVVSWGAHSEIRIRRIRRDQSSLPVVKWWNRRAKPSERTRLFLRQYDLWRRYQSEPVAAIEVIQRNCRRHPTMSQVHALAELAKIEADWAKEQGKTERAAQMYAVSVVQAYRFLFDPDLNLSRNAYDPQFRSICDIYNRSLAGLLRILCLGEGECFQPGQTRQIGNVNLGLEFQVQIEGRWRAEEFDRFELVDDYEMKGIDNSYQTFGLGVPLIAVRKSDSDASQYEQYYPPSLSLPMTAFCELLPSREGNGSYQAIIRLFDPLEYQSIEQTNDRQ